MLSATTMATSSSGGGDSSSSGQCDSSTKRLPLWQKLVVGAIAGVVGTTVIFPLDLVKTSMQAVSSGIGVSPTPSASASASTSASATATATATAAGSNGNAALQSTSVSHFVRSLYAQGGMRAFYRGLAPNLIGIAPEKAIKLAANFRLRELLADSKDGSMTLRDEMLAAAGAGVLQVFVTTPMELFKVRLQLETALPAEERIGAMGILERLGLKNMFRGLLSTACRDISFNMMFFPLFAKLVEAMRREDGTSPLRTVFFSGTVAGAVASGIVTPMDVVKTRLQQQGGKAEYSNIRRCVRKVLTDEGPRAFFNGVGFRMASIGPLFGVTVLVYEMQKRLVLTGRLSG